MRDVAKLPDLVGAVQIHRELDAGLVLKRVACPLGVLGVIFESRPDAVMQISSLAVKSGNGVILKSGKEAVESCRALVAAIKDGLAQAGFDPAAVQLLTTREETCHAGARSVFRFDHSPWIQCLCAVCAK